MAAATRIACEQCGGTRDLREMAVGGDTVTLCRGCRHERRPDPRPMDNSIACPRCGRYHATAAARAACSRREDD